MNYPNGIKKQKKHHDTNYGNRGMTLEKDLNQSNEYYRNMDIAYIYKKPTPIKITKVDYPCRSQAIIKEAFFQSPSTTDYNGIYKGRYIDFEAKETKSSTAFPINNIHPHQILHIKNMIRHGGIAFLIIRFTNLDKTFLLLGNDLIYFLQNEKRKSIPLSYFEECAYLVKDSYQPRIDYLKIIDEIVGGINYAKKEC